MAFGAITGRQQRMNRIVDGGARATGAAWTRQETGVYAARTVRQRRRWILGSVQPGLATFVTGGTTATDTGMNLSRGRRWRQEFGATQGRRSGWHGARRRRQILRMTALARRRTEQRNMVAGTRGQVVVRQNHHAGDAEETAAVDAAAVADCAARGAGTVIKLSCRKTGRCGAAVRNDHGWRGVAIGTRHGCRHRDVDR